MIWLTLVLVVVLPTLLYVRTRKWIRQVETRFPPAGKFVTVEGIRLHFVRKGSGRPVVMLHGGILSALDYASVLDMVESLGFQGIAFDRPGYGYSDRPRTKLDPIAQARLLHNATKQLGLEKPILVGHSWSGLLVLAYALEYPNELSGIVLLAPAAYGGEAYPTGPLDDALYYLIKTPVVGKVLTNTLLPVLGRSMAKPSVQMAFAPDPVPETYLEAAISIWPRPKQIWANREDVFTFRPAADQLSMRYGEIQVPVMIVVGDADPFYPQLQSYRLHKELPQSRLTVLEKTGHMIPLVYPEAVANAINLVMENE